MAEESTNNDEVMHVVDKYVENASYKKLISLIPKRLFALIGKCISIKVLILALATGLFLLFPELFPWYAWIIIAGMVIFGREFLKFMEKIKK